MNSKTQDDAPLKWRQDVDDGKIALKKPLILMANEGYHKIINYPPQGYELIEVAYESGDFYIGNWIEGFGFIHIQFPKSATRPLTEQEIAKYSKRTFYINDTPLFTLRKNSQDGIVETVSVRNG